MTQGSSTSQRSLATALANPGIARFELDKLDAEERLMDYCRQSWHVLEPARPMKTGWAIEQVAEHLEYVHHGHILRLLVNVPPGFMKSMLFNVFFPTWEWGPRNRPDLRYVHASYTDVLTVRDNVKARRLIKSPWYQERWGDRFDLMGDQDAKVKFENDRTGWKLATSIRGTGTGERGDRGMIDDPHKVKEAESETRLDDAVLWFAEEWPSRINDPDKSAQMCIMQRVHERDVSGHILSAARSLGYTVLMIPMEFEIERTCYTVVVPPWLKLGDWTVPKKVVKDSRTGVETEVEDGPHIPPPTDAKMVKWAKLHNGHTITRQQYDEPWELHRETQEALTQAENAGTLLWEEGYKADPRENDGDLAWPEMYSKTYLDEQLKPQLRMIGGGYAEAGQLQQRPTLRGGGMFQRKWFQPIRKDQLPPGRVICRAWDLAGTKNKRSANTASVKVSRKGRNIYVEHVLAFQGTPHEVDEKIVECAEVLDERHVDHDFPQDPGQAGVAQKSHIAGLLHGFRVFFSADSGSKEMRAQPLASQAQAGNVYIVEGPWNEDFLVELSVFPRGAKKDRVDAFSRAYARLLKAREEDVPVGAQVVSEARGGNAGGERSDTVHDDEHGAGQGGLLIIG